ncbi:MAG: GNAT family N-acetyltransferase [Planctomycetota bacterium]|nr:GNAT family N-acetyltransferase [Planctomycetota bacterium]
MKILFLHGWTSVPGGVKPSFLRSRGNTVYNPALPDNDFSNAVRIAQTEFDRYQPDVVVGSSRGGALAMNIRSGTAPLVLLCPAWKRWGKATRSKGRTWVLHSRADDVVDYADSELLVQVSGLDKGQLIETGHDHRLADELSLEAMWDACRRSQGADVGVTVYYLEMHDAPPDPAPPPPTGVHVLEVVSPTVDYYRFLYNAVGNDYHWESRGALTDPQLQASIQDPKNVLYVLHVEGSPAGYAELDLRRVGEVELLQFGLFPTYLGRGLGRWFLRWTIEKVWSESPRRFWLHTCTLDHPAAVPNYLNHGFTQYSEERIQRTLPVTDRSSI